MDDVLQRRTSRAQLVDVLVLWIGSRLLFELIAVAVRAVTSHANARSGFFGLLYQWDSGYFGCIAQQGYSGAGAGCVADPVAGRPSFFPGYPLLARGLAWVLGAGTVSTGTVAAAMWVVTQVAALVAAWALYRLAAGRADGAPDVTVARVSTGLLLLGPYAVFLVASYSEAMFLAFAIPAWLATTRRQYLLAGVLAAGASFTRINGVFLGVALLVLWWTRTGPRSGHDRRVRQAAALALSFTGAAGYLIWLWAKTGDISAWTHSQRDVFDRHQEWPWSTLRQSLALLVRDHRSAFVLQHTLEFVAAALMLWALVALVRRAEWAAAVFVALTLISLMTSTSYLSLARNSVTLFPLAVLVADVAVHSRRRTLVRAALAASGVLTVVNAVQLARGQWAD